jgi:hypothetical protein
MIAINLSVILNCLKVTSGKFTPNVPAKIAFEKITRRIS